MIVAIALVVALAVTLALTFGRFARSDSWRATVTPLASIIGSGFLICGPLLAREFRSARGERERERERESARGVGRTKPRDDQKRAAEAQAEEREGPSEGRAFDEAGPGAACGHGHTPSGRAR